MDRISSAIITALLFTIVGTTAPVVIAPTHHPCQPTDQTTDKIQEQVAPPPKVETLKDAIQHPDQVDKAGEVLEQVAPLPKVETIQHPDQVDKAGEILDVLEHARNPQIIRPLTNPLKEKGQDE